MEIAMVEDTPASLPAIDTVEIVDLRALEANRISEYMPIAKDAPHWSVSGDEARMIATLFRTLAAGEGMRGHVPIFGFRFSSEKRLVSEALACWQCDNIRANQWHSIERNPTAERRSLSPIKSRRVVGRAVRLGSGPSSV
jgi:hypothetical protein